MKETKNVLIVGVGGQGVLLASEILCAAAVAAGLDAKKSEVHGMAQRGGVVSSHVRMGEKVYSPLIKEGEADVILAFEQAEALRWVHFMKKKGTIIINRYKLVPPIASMKGFEYPPSPVEAVQKRVKNVRVIDAFAVAESLGNLRLVNVLLLGVLSVSLEIPQNIWKQVIDKHVPRGTEAINWKAFQEGCKKG